MRLFPVYTEFYSAINDIKALQEPDAPKKAIFRKCATSSITIQDQLRDTVNPYKDMKLINTGNVKALQLKYEVRKPLLYNLDFVAMFDRTYDWRARVLLEVSAATV